MMVNGPRTQVSTMRNVGTRAVAPNRNVFAHDDLWADGTIEKYTKRPNYHCDKPNYHRPQAREGEDDKPFTGER